LYARAEYINHAFQSLVSLLVEQHENPVSSNQEKLEPSIQELIQKKRESSIQELMLLSPEGRRHIMDQFFQRNENVDKSSKGTEHHVAVDIKACAPNSAPASPLIRRGPVKLPSRAIAKV
jgi:hypothetical protein